MGFYVRIFSFYSSYFALLRVPFILHPIEKRPRIRLVYGLLRGNFPVTRDNLYIYLGIHGSDFVRGANFRVVEIANFHAVFPVDTTAVGYLVRGAIAFTPILSLSWRHSTTIYATSSTLRSVIMINLVTRGTTKATMGSSLRILPAIL